MSFHMVPLPLAVVFALVLHIPCAETLKMKEAMFMIVTFPAESNWTEMIVATALGIKTKVTNMTEIRLLHLCLCFE